jgi:2-dehydro-3-deoxyphosphogluconate aldolase / (4S)-4-hydroxy-2-oxoglutarate aldolase
VIRFIPLHYQNFRHRSQCGGKRVFVSWKKEREAAQNNIRKVIDLPKRDSGLFSGLRGGEGIQFGNVLELAALEWNVQPESMRAKDEIIEALLKPGIIAVVRALAAEQVIPLSEALIAGGIHAIEITMTTPNAIDGITHAVKHFGRRALIGVGTVLDTETARKAISAGAEFVVSPITRPEIAKMAAAEDRPVMLGAYTPSEAQLAYESGADFIKLFPADMLGIAYIKAIRAPLPHLRIVPTGGVTVENIRDFFKAGCPAVGVGSSMITREILEKGNWPELTRKAQEFVRAAQG